ncbi:MAG: nuclear transport factor 2 family protein, partial [Usitatibacteraceae bacterium]
LYRRIESIDRSMFDAFNRCELKKLESFFIPDLEFYHDNDGLSTSRIKFIGDVQKNVCGKFRRELVAGSMEVWPLGEYGAVYSGTHRFCQTGSGKCEGTGRFMHILRNQDGEWKITRVVSYDHKAAP